MKAVIFLTSNGFFLKDQDLANVVKPILKVNASFSHMDLDTYRTVQKCGAYPRPVIYTRDTEFNTLHRIARLASDILEYQKGGSCIIQSRELLMACISLNLVDELEVRFVDLDYPRTTGDYSSKEFPFHDNNYRWRRTRAIRRPDDSISKGYFVREYYGEKKAPRITKKDTLSKLNKLVF